MFIVVVCWWGLCMSFVVVVVCLLGLCVCVCVLFFGEDSSV